MKKILSISIFLLSIVTLNAQTEFITTWKTDNPGTSNSTSIIIPTFSGETYNYDVDWNNDGVYNLVDIGKTGSVTHDFGTPGTYTIRIRGTFPRIFFSNALDRLKILSVDQWGTISWSSMNRAFAGCGNLIINASDTPDLSQVTDMSFMFNNATVINQDISSWNTSNVTTMFALFANALAFNQDLSSWNVENVTNLANMFNNVSLSNANYEALLIGWDAQNLQPNLIFNVGNSKYCSQPAVDARANMITSDGWTITDGGQDCGPLSYFKTTWKTDNPGTSNSTSISIPTFSGETYNYDVDWDNDGVFDDLGVTGNITHDFGTAGTYTINIKGVFPRIYFYNSGEQLKILSVEQWGTTNWTSMRNAFRDCGNLVINAIDTPDLSSVTNMSGMFYTASSFNQDISSWDISKVSDISFLFAAATSFNQNLSAWDTSNVTNMSALFASAISFNQDISSWDTSSVTNTFAMFNNAIAFDQDLSVWNIENVTDLTSMFNGVTLSDANYEALLIGWNTQNLQPNLAFSGGNSQYCSQAAADARANMIASDGWTITDGGACSALSTENIELESVSLYPNPSSAKIAIKGLTEIAKISVFDITGKQVYSARNHNNEVINITNFKPGFYLVKIQNSKGSKTLKLLVD